MILLLAILTFFAVLLLTPKFGGCLRKKGIVGVDVNKEKKPKIPEQGGLIVVAVSMLAYSVYALLAKKYFLLANVYVLLLVSLFGLLDHYKHFRPREKILVPLAIGLIATPMVFPFAYTPFGTFYAPLALAALFVVSFPIFSNLTNMLAGFNGIEVGLGAIASFALVIVSLLLPNSDALALSFILFAALSAFWIYNRYPARIFPGDSLTLFCGAAFTLIAFPSGLAFYLPILLLPQIADAFLKFSSAGIMSREDFRPVRVKKGRLFVGRNTYLSICRSFLLKGALTEQELVTKVLWLGVLSAALTVLIAYGGLQ